MENNEESKVNEEEIKKEQSSSTQQLSSKNPGLYTAGLACSIVGLCLFWSTLIGLVCGVLGIVFGAITYSKTNNKTPIIIGGIATCLAIMMMIVYPIIVKNVLHKTANDIQNHLREAVESTTDEEGKNALDRVEDAFENAVDTAKEDAEKQEEKMNSARDQVQQEYNEIQNDINKTSVDLTKQVQDVINN